MYWPVASVVPLATVSPFLLYTTTVAPATLSPLAASTAKTSILPIAAVGQVIDVLADAAGAPARAPTIATINPRRARPFIQFVPFTITFDIFSRSEEHTSELQSPCNL